MNIYINSRLQEITAGANITDILSTLDIMANKGMAVAVNNNVIPRTEWNKYELKNEDKIMLIKATQGG